MLALSTAAFVAFGAILVLVGANQHHLARALELDLSRTGLLGAGVSLGLSIGVIAAGPLVDRLPRRPLFVAAAALSSVSLLFVRADASLATALVAICLAGFGGGIYETVLNAVVVEARGERATPALNLLHAGATFGAFVAPLLIAAFAGDGFEPSFRATALLCLLVAGAGLFVPLPGPRGGRDAGPAPPLRWRGPLPALCAVGFVYVGLETAITVFAVPYANALGLPAVEGQRGISLFWLGLLTGRLAIGFSGRSPAEGYLALAGAGAVLLVGGGWALGLSPVLWLGPLGLAIAGTFPVMVALAGRDVAGAAGRSVAAVIACGGLGGFAVPWCAGQLGDALGVRAAFASLALFGALLAAAAGLARRAR